MLLFFGNKIEAIAWIPDWMHTLLNAYGTLIATLLLISFFGGLWLAERNRERDNRQALRIAANRIQLPVCPECLSWRSEEDAPCRRCVGDLRDPIS